MKFGITGSKLRKKLLSSVAILSLAFTGLVALSTPASAAGEEILTFESGQTVIGPGVDTKAISTSAPIEGTGHIDWAPFGGDNAFRNAVGADWVNDGVGEGRVRHDRA